ncbi:efflux RND transporter periplasmic adaptor subunit [Spirochaeta thermophila]|uniref:Uncharacterized protein n=1 Tax=Winmispira thermophila (strain ATCC 49972 / DSM 6192 / RI 19.B1) TaxID=665571 RepID=E0RQI4_WINT6|nr:efflux RND transporter periplasmic adaptor subunit [Spirochaeta thermophila]ADN02960.1 hypothetical protein STHERM_c20250 [Spirochaeta thermophila DSM 6192]
MNRTTFLLLVGVLLSLAGCGERAPERTGSSVVPVVEVRRVHMEKVEPVITSFGTVTYTQKADVTTQVDGTLERFFKEEGERVREGEPVARLSNIQLEIRKIQAQSALKSAEAQARLAEARYRDALLQAETRFLSLEKLLVQRESLLHDIATLEKEYQDRKILFEAGGIPEDTLRDAENALLKARNELKILEKNIETASIGLRDEDILSAGFPLPTSFDERKKLLIRLNTRVEEAQVEVAKAQVEVARAEIQSVEALSDETILRSPIDGVLGTRYVEPGEYLKENTRVCTIFSSEDAWVVFSIPEKEALLLKEGLEANIHVEALDQTLTGRIDAISPFVDPKTGNVTVKARLPRFLREARPGMFARVSVKTGTTVDRILLPKEALLHEEGDKGEVFVVRNNHIFRRTLTLGVSRENKKEVLEGLNEGELVVINPSPLLREGQEVEVVEIE